MELLLSSSGVLNCRDMVIAAFRRRPEWEVTEVEGTAEGTATSQLHWGEYEGIDWERVHQGCVTSSVHFLTTTAHLCRR